MSLESHESEPMHEPVVEAAVEPEATPNPAPDPAPAEAPRRPRRLADNRLIALALAFVVGLGWMSDCGSGPSRQTSQRRVDPVEGVDVEAAARRGRQTERRRPRPPQPPAEQVFTRQTPPPEAAPAPARRSPLDGARRPPRPEPPGRPSEVVEAWESYPVVTGIEQRSSPRGQPPELPQGLRELEQKLLATRQALLSGGGAAGLPGLFGGQGAALGAAGGVPTDSPAANPPRRRLGTTLPAGTILNGEVLNAVNSDTPGLVSVRLSRDVRRWEPEHRRYGQVLIPAGSVLLGRYDDTLQVDQTRIGVAFDTLRLPTGEELALEGTVGSDQEGAAGWRDRVNHHTGRTLGRAALYGLVAGLFDVARPAEDNSRSDATYRFQEGLVGPLEQASAELLRGSPRRPTLRIRAGTRVTVTLMEGLEL